jgi:hypothetical protein
MARRRENFGQHFSLLGTGNMSGFSRYSRSKVKNVPSAPASLRRLSPVW